MLFGHRVLSQNLQHFFEFDAALWTTEQPNEREIVKAILNSYEDENEQADDDTKEIV